MSKPRFSGFLIGLASVPMASAAPVQVIDFAEPLVTASIAVADPETAVTDPSISEIFGPLATLPEDAALQVARRFNKDARVGNATLSEKGWELLFSALVEAESGYQPDALSEKGAIGLTQLMPATAADLGVDPHNREDNLEGGAEYLLRQLARFGRVDYALAAYNAGPEAVIEYGGIPPYPETQNYIARITGLIGDRDLFQSVQADESSASPDPAPFLFQFTKGVS